MKKLRVTVNGKSYDVVVEEMESAGSAAPVAAPSAVTSSVAPPVVSQQSAPAPQAAAAGDVASPLAGRVVAVNCAVGEAVAAGATLITLEAMKMNTFVSAAVAGTVKVVYVKEGDAVEEGQPLVGMA